MRVGVAWVLASRPRPHARWVRRASPRATRWPDRRPPGRVGEELLPRRIREGVVGQATAFGSASRGGASGAAEGAIGVGEGAHSLVEIVGERDPMALRAIGVGEGADSLVLLVGARDVAAEGAIGVAEGAHSKVSSVVAHDSLAETALKLGLVLHLRASRWVPPLGLCRPVPDSTRHGDLAPSFMTRLKMRPSLRAAMARWASMGPQVPIVEEADARRY